MTCIVAVTDGQTVVLGGDSAGTRGQELRLRADPKVFRVGGYAIGFTTSFRMGQILRYGTDLPEPPPAVEPGKLDRFMVAELIPALRQSYADHGFAKTARFPSSASPAVTEEGQEIGGLFLLDVAGQIFEVGNDYQVGRPAVPYSAIGAGSLVALGALHALESHKNLSLQERATLALEASEAYSTSVRRPFQWVELPSTPATVSRETPMSAQPTSIHARS